MSEVYLGTKRPRRPHTVRGFTLIELMITVVIIGILAVIAYPSYQRQVHKTRRTDGKVALLDTAQRLERCFTRFNRYSDGGCAVAAALEDGIESPEGWYLVTEAALGATTFTLVATPQGDQTKDGRCGNLTLTQTGARTATGSEADTCW